MMTARGLRTEESTRSSQSQVRRRFDLGGNSTSTTHPKIIPFDRRESEEAMRGANDRPTIPTPRPRISLGTVPTRLVDEKSMRRLPLDQRAAFLLTNIDGETPVRSLVDVTCMQPEEVLVLIERLVELQAIALL